MSLRRKWNVCLLGGAVRRPTSTQTSLLPDPQPCSSSLHSSTRQCCTTPSPQPPLKSSAEPYRFEANESLGVARDGASALHPRRPPYSKEGFSYVEQLRTWGAGAVPRRIRMTLSLYAAAYSVAIFYIGYYLTTYTYILTTDPSVHRSTLFQRFSSDMMVIENRLTHQRHTVVAHSAAPPLHDELQTSVENAIRPVSEEAVPNTAPQRSATIPSKPILERTVRVNALLNRVFVYLQTTSSTVPVDVQSELEPNRFRACVNKAGAIERAPVGFLRVDQRIVDPTERPVAAPQSWQPYAGWWRRSERTAPPPSLTSSSPSSLPSGPTQVVVESEVRLRDAINGYQKGHLYTYEETIRHLVRKKVEARYRAYLLTRAMGAQHGLRKVYAEEMLRNGLLSGKGVTLPMLVPDVDQFAEEVVEEVRRKFGDDAIIYLWKATLR